MPDTHRPTDFADALGVPWAAVLLPARRSPIPVDRLHRQDERARGDVNQVDVRAGQQGMRGSDLVAVGFGAGVDRDDDQSGQSCALGLSAMLRSRNLRVNRTWVAIGRDRS